MSEKHFFKRPSVSDLQKKQIVFGIDDLDTMTAQLATLLPSQSFCVTEHLLKGEPPHRFKKRGPSIIMSPRQENYQYIPPRKTGAIILSAKLPQTPLQNLEAHINLIDRFDLSGYGWRGEGPDQRYRHVALTKLLAGAMLFAYESKIANNPEVTLYEGTHHATEQGLIAYTTISSEEAKAPRREIMLSGIPIHKYAQWRRVSSQHACPGKMWSEARYDHPLDYLRIMFCKHEIAAYFKIAAYCAAQKENKYPALMSPFVPPSQELVDFYKKLRRQTFVKESSGERLINEGEMEQFLFCYISNIGPKKAFHTEKSHANYLLKDRDWS